MLWASCGVVFLIFDSGCVQLQMGSSGGGHPEVQTTAEAVPVRPGKLLLTAARDSHDSSMPVAQHCAANRRHLTAPSVLSGCMAAQTDGSEPNKLSVWMIDVIKVSRNAPLRNALH